MFSGDFEEGGLTGFWVVVCTFDALIEFVPVWWEGVLKGHVFGAVVDEVAKVFGGGGVVTAHRYIVAQVF